MLPDQPTLHLHPRHQPPLEGSDGIVVVAVWMVAWCEAWWHGVRHGDGVREGGVIAAPHLLRLLLHCCQFLVKLLN